MSSYLSFFGLRLTRCSDSASIRLAELEDSGSFKSQTIIETPP